MNEVSESQNPYHYTSNNPTLRIDPTGLTDYAFNKETGQLSEVENTRTEEGFDRILQTDSTNNIEYDKNGEAKTLMNEIKKGFLKDGHNFKDDDIFYSVGGENNLTEKDIMNFLSDLSSNVLSSKELGGFTYTNINEEKISGFQLLSYEGNTKTSTKYPAGTAKLTRESLNAVGGGVLAYKERFHTHYDNPTFTEEYGKSTIEGDKQLNKQIDKINKSALKTFIIAPRGNRLNYTKNGLVK